MANTSQSLITLDFATYKNSLKQYLKNNPVFKDYEYESSNMSLLLDLLAYNTFQTGFYTNMTMAESFIDSAQLRSSILSHAKDLNYLPVSTKSAKAQVNVVFTATGTNSPYIIPKGSPFSTIIKSKAYVFYTSQNIVANYIAPNTYWFNADIFEGQYVNDTYIYPASTNIQRFKLTNQNIDTDSITVTVFENGNQTGDTYIPTDTLLGLDGTSKVYFIQPASDGYYEILFGDNIFGRQPLVNAVINVNYRVTEGSGANGAKVFSCDFDPTGVNEVSSSPVTTTLTTAADGAEQESIENIRAYAPRYFATQQRAVSSDDYASLILAKFPSQISDVNPYGGETLSPKRYGWVAIALKPTTGDVVPDYVKSQVLAMLQKYISVPNKVLLQDPEYFYLKIDSTIEFDSSKTTKSSVDILTAVKSAMINFAENNFETFGGDFRYSRFVNAIDNADESIVSNDTTVTMIKRLTPTLNIATTYNLNFDNKAKVYDNVTEAFDNDPVFYSSSFDYIDPSGQQIWYNCFLQDDNQGNIVIMRSDGSESLLVNGSAGTINYDDGTVNIPLLMVANYTNHISLYYKTENKDILVDKNNIIMVDLNDCNLTLEAI